MKKLIKPLDIIIVCVVLLLGAGYSLFSGLSTANAIATVFSDGKVFCTVDLSAVQESYELTVPNKSVVLLVEKGAISFKKSDCKDGICMACGKLSRNGDTAACLPNKVVISIKSGEKSEIDAIVY